MARLESHWLLCLSVAGLLLAPQPADAEIFDCDDPYLSADAETSELADVACKSAIQAKALLQSCGLVQSNSITIAVVESATHPSFGPCLALFDKRTGCLQVTDVDRLPLLLPENDARTALPPDVIFAATITHEMAHALLQQSAGDGRVGATEQEFVANALEMESLAPQWRDILLAADPVKSGGSMGLINLGIYALAPRVFANNAWQFFRRDVVGCALVGKIAAGEFRFPLQ